MPETHPSADPGPSPGAQFVKIRWIQAVDREPIGSIEWAESRRAAGLVRDGYAVLVDAD